MFIHVSEARYVRDYTIWLRFNDGAQGEIDLRHELSGEMFAPLQDVMEFCRFRVDPETHTLAWENGADMAPEFLHAQLKALV
jgi:hypothetical protein